MSLGQLENIRRAELRSIMAIMQARAPKGSRLLEIGAGTGWQARAMTDAGYVVEAIDMESSPYTNDRVFPIQDYDGHRLPFPNGIFDAIYSSNVLEHVPHEDEFQKELMRVLKPDGIVIHVVPSGGWRLLSNLAHYPYIARSIARRVAGGVKDDAAVVTTPTKQLAPPTAFHILRRALIPNRDGERGNAYTEAWYFSRWYWAQLFKRNGWSIVSRTSNNLVYSAYYVFGEALPIGARKALSHVLGGACHVFVLRPADRNS
jgi:SAM-dependent methyltransferase